MAQNMKKSMAGIIGALAVVEFVSGILQGYYIPLLTDVAQHFGVHDADVNWLEGSQLMFSALMVPLFAKLGDRVGHAKMLLLSTALTAAASLALVFAGNWWLFLAAWTLQGVYTVWLPLEIALVWARAADSPTSKAQTAKAAGILVCFLEVGAICGALAGGALIDAFPLQLVLVIPAVAVVLCTLAVLFFVRDRTQLGAWYTAEQATTHATTQRAAFDSRGLVLLSLALLCLTGGLSMFRVPALVGYAALAVVAGLVVLVPFVRHALRHADPLIDVRMFRNPALWPLFLTAGLFGMSVLGAQAPLSTFARTDPAVYGYGLGVKGFTVSLLIGVYVLMMAVGALLFPLIRRWWGAKNALTLAAFIVGCAYLLFLPFHDTYTQTLLNMMLAGVGSGMLVAALPAAAAAAAPQTQTGVATGLTNSVKTVGGAVASCVFGIALLQGAAGSAGSLSGYLTVWTICGLSALVAALCLLLIVPKRAL